MSPVFPFDEPSSAFRFARTALDRRAELRDDAEALARLWDDPASRVFVLEGGRVVVRPDGDDRIVAALDRATAVAAGGRAEDRVFLGIADGRAHFALPTPPAAEGDPERPTVDLRRLAVDGSLPADDYGALAAARSLLNWHDGHRFCSRCGTGSTVASAGWRRVCPACGAEHFPRTDPVVIMTIEDGDRCLLGHGRAFVEGMWSCLAGFVEPGETVEAAVRREAFEEAGVRIGGIRYFASEPWPFPGSLMVAMRAEALTTELRVDPVELADARWFDRAEIRRLLAGDHPDGLFAPPPIAVAHHLMRRFVEDV
ncbi:MAG: NAD(+) diphosphatase [Phyllobacteriaceae bacterium]|nr:NAD(+) diphosphatase [Phyllobacteriaceae bacterium]